MLDKRRKNRRQQNRMTPSATEGIQTQYNSDRSTARPRPDMKRVMLKGLTSIT